jgi:hypothetical protein
MAATPDAGPAALSEAIRGLLTPGVVALAAAGVLGTVLLGVVARGVGSAATVSAVDAGLRDEAPLPGAVAGVAAHWRAFVGLAAVRLAVYLAVGGAVLAVGAAAGAAVGAAAVGLALLVVLLAAPVLVVVELVLGFAGPAVVVDGAGTTAALRRAVGLARDRPVAYLVLAATLGVLLVVVLVAAAVATVAGVGRAVGLLTTFVLFPLFDGLRVALYADRDPALAGEPPARSALSALRAAPATGLRALGGFLRDHPAANAASAGLLAVGFAGGWALVAPYGVGVGPTGDVGSVFGAVPVGPFLNIAANNWLVGATAGFGGLAAAAPTVVALVFNGAFLGVVAGVTDRTAFLALVAPHAVLELPAVAVAGGLGLHLGRVGVGAVRGDRDAGAVADALASGFRVLLGLAVVFVVAAAVEAFVTPAVAASVLG